MYFIAYLQVFVQSCVVNVVNISTASANATLDGRARSAVCGTMNVRCQTAMVMDIAPTANAIVFEASRENSAKKVCAKQFF